MKLDLSLQIRRAREARGLSLRTLGRMIGVSSSSLNRWEMGRGIPTEPASTRLSSVLGISISCSTPGFVKLDSFHRGALLRALRVRSGLSLAEVSQLFWYSAGALSRWENGQRDPGEHVIRLYIRNFNPTATEVEALRTGEAPSPFANPSREEVSSFVDELRLFRFENPFEPLDIQFLAADVAIVDANPRLRLQLSDAYIEWLQWEYREREAHQWAHRNLQEARASHDYDYTGRAVRAIVHHLIVEERRPLAGLEFLNDALRFARGSASEGMVMREVADRLAFMGQDRQAREALAMAFEANTHEGQDVHLNNCEILQSALFLATGRLSSALDVLPERSQADPYMEHFTTQLRAELYDALGDRDRCMQILESGAGGLDRPGLGHFSEGLRDRLEFIRGQAYSPELWKEGRSARIKRLSLKRA